jgi:dethiobiotin synthetase
MLAAHEMELSVWVVVNNKLGALNHTLLTVRAIRDRGLRTAGLILNHVADERDPASISHRVIFEKMLPDVPVVAEIIHGESELDADFLLA